MVRGAPKAHRDGDLEWRGAAGATNRCGAEHGTAPVLDRQGRMGHASVRALQALQRQAGNAAVSRLVSAGREEQEDHEQKASPGSGVAVPIVELPGPAAAPSIPKAAGGEEKAVDLPEAEALQREAGNAGTTVQRVDSCGQPLSMVKVISGSLRNGLGMGDYYPDLVGAGYWDSATTAGPFDTGTRCGSNVQLVGTIPSPCRPEQFSLAQTVTYTKRTFDGVRSPDEGKTFDDIAKSGRDASGPPFRQDWLEGGYAISMADPPSLAYRGYRSVEMDRDFVTTLNGPSGSKSVSWATSIRITGGAVTHNTVS